MKQAKRDPKGYLLLVAGRVEKEGHGDHARIKRWDVHGCVEQLQGHMNVGTELQFLAAGLKVLAHSAQRCPGEAELVRAVARARQAVLSVPPSKPLRYQGHALRDAEGRL